MPVPPTGALKSANTSVITRSPGRILSLQALFPPPGPQAATSPKLNPINQRIALTYTSDRAVVCLFYGALADAVGMVSPGTGESDTWLARSTLICTDFLWVCEFS